MPLKGKSMPDEPASPLIHVVPTSDGSVTLLHTGFNQTYHSVNGALQEARHVFLQEGLLYFLNQRGAKAARVLEVGFGAGLNFLVSAAYCLENGLGAGQETGPSLIYTGIEPFPLGKDVLKKSNYAKLLPLREQREAYLSWYPGMQPLCLHPNVQLELRQEVLLKTSPLPIVDIVYFDAFAPATQPEMWTPEAISHVASALEPGGIFVSYSITGNLKRILKGLGFTVEKPKGAAGKREMIRAVKR